MQTQQIRRRSNGTIDIDSYRQEALVLRAQAMRRLSNKGRLLPWPLIGAVAIVVAYVTFLPRTPVPPSASSMLVSANLSLMSD
jgi:hypothetical protein